MVGGFEVRKLEFDWLMICMPQGIEALVRPQMPVVQIELLGSAGGTFGGVLRRLVVDRF